MKLFFILLYSTFMMPQFLHSNNPLPSECNYFASALSTRTECSTNGGGTIEFTGKANIYNNPSTELFTCVVVTPQWILNQTQTCQSGDCVEKPGNTKSLSLNYNQLPTPSHTDISPANSNTNITIDEDKRLKKANYNVIEFNWEGEGKTATFQQSWLVNTLRINELKSTWQILFKDSADIKIGTITGASYGSPINLKTESNNIKTIEIHSISYPKSTTIELHATESIDIASFEIARGSNVTLKAPTITIDTLHITNNGSGTAAITIIADAVNITTLTMEQNAQVTIKPYTQGKQVTFKSDTLSASSSSELILFGGSYYTKNFDIPGTSNISSVRANDATQIINFYINNNFRPGNNPGINSAGNNGNFGNLPAQNFRLFINGDLNTGGGGTTFNAIIYVEGNAVLGNPTFIKGALSAQNSIKIGEDSKIYYSDGIDENGWGTCPAPDYDNHFSCGIFQNVLTSYDSITSNANNAQACYTANISYPQGQLTGDISCNQNGCGGGSSCQRSDPPRNKLHYTILDTTISGTSAALTTLTDLYYGDLSYGKNKTISFEPTHTYADNSTPLMVLGNVSVQKDTLKFQPGDYYFQSLSIDSNGNNIELPNGGPVRIFIKNDLNVSMNNLHLNTTGNQNNLFIYVGGNFNSLGNGGGTTQMKAFVYVKGSATLNNNSNNWKIYGGITAEGPITINGNNPDFIQQGSAEDLGYGNCQMCYSDIKVNGVSFGMGSCPGFDISIGQKIKVPIISSQTLYNASVEEAHKKAIFSFSAFNTHQVRDQDDTKIRDAQESDSGLSAGAMGMDVSLFGNKVITYPLGDDNGTYGPNTTDNYHQLYTSALFGFDMCEWKESLVYVAHYEDGNGRHYDVKLSQCQAPATVTSNHVSGPFDAWDTFRDNNTTPPSDRNISTKIANQAFKLSLASLNKTNDAYETKTGTGVIDVAIYPVSSSTAISNHLSFDVNSTAHISESAEFNVSLAQREAVVGFKLCATYEVNPVTNQKDYILYPSQACAQDTTLHDCNASTNTLPTWHICHAGDSFAIRPYAFTTFGKNQYKRAGEDFNITIKAVDENNYSKVGNASYDGQNSDTINGVNNYNSNLSSLQITSNFYTPTAAEIHQMQSDTGKSDVATCPNAGIFTVTNPSASFTNGEVNASLKFSETGILDLTISERDGQEWALVDSDDTNNTQRYIQSSTITYSTSNINAKTLQLFVPYEFNTTAECNTTTQASWLYMHDINTSNTTFTTPKMAAYVKYTIIALNKDGDIVQNYTKSCFPDVDEINCPRVNGLKLNTTFDLFLDMDVNISRAQDISLYTEDNNSNAVWTYQKNKHLTNGTNLVREWISPFQFERGKGEATVYFNIDKNISSAINPVTIRVLDANTSTSWMTLDGSPKYFNGYTLNKELIFYYGRTHVMRQQYKGTDGNATIYYEVYCDGASCNKSLLQDGNNSLFSDDPRWFINTQHTTAAGVPGDAKQKTAPIRVTATTHGINYFSLQYDASRGYPYKTTMENNASQWLIYNKYNPTATKNSFEVEFINPAGNWAGVHETNTTTKQNASKTTNRRTLW
jgi:hypothetical protein